MVVVSFDKRKELDVLREQFKECTEFLLAIGDASRQRILIAIMEGEFGGSRIGDTAKKAHLSDPAVSHHLKTLKEAGIGKSYSRGTKNYYYIDASSSGFSKVKHMILSFESVAYEFAKTQNYEI